MKVLGVCIEAPAMGHNSPSSLSSSILLPLLVLFSSTLPLAGNARLCSFAERDRQPTCVDIPSNMTLCQNIGYTKMRLPNLVEHDTLHEVSQQSMSWIPLLNIKCHPDTQLFLCSLFSPVCLERPIYPCRSLCLGVRQGCQGRMEAYGFPWPAMLDCAKFPQDNDMCITAQSVRQGNSGNSGGNTRGSSESSREDRSRCEGAPCNQHVTAENILDHFCQADFVVKVRIRKVLPRKLVGKKAQVFRAWKGTRAEMKALRNPKFSLRRDERCCADRARENRNGKFLVMGRRPTEANAPMQPTFIAPWSKSKEIKRARRMFKSMDCDNLKETSQKMIVDTFAPRRPDNRRRRGSRRGKSRRGLSIWDGIRN